MTLLIDTFQDLQCPNCGKSEQVRSLPSNAARMHPCPKLGGMIAPLIRTGTSAKVEIRLREDYVGQELVQTDDRGRPVMSVITTRDNGQDAIVFAPTATGRVGDAR
jgi:hypothetical protein